jgi:hypothetical protein
MAKSMLQALESHAASNFHFLCTGDESWMFYEYHHETMLAALWKELDELERPTHYHRKTMLTAFFNGTVEYLPNILPRNRSMDTASFAGDIICGSEDASDSERRNRHEGKRTLHFNNAPIHNARTVMGQLK